MAREASSCSLGRLRSLHLLSKPLALNGLLKRSTDSSESWVNEWGTTTNLLELAEKKRSCFSLPNPRGKSWRELQSSLRVTSDFSSGSDVGRCVSWFLERSRHLRETASGPAHSCWGNSVILFPASLSSTNDITLISCGKLLMVLLEKSMLLREVKDNNLLSTLFKFIPTASIVSSIEGKPLIGYSLLLLTTSLVTGLSRSFILGGSEEMDRFCWLEDGVLISIRNCFNLTGSAWTGQ